MSTVFLRVKIRSLAAEARIIRHEEDKCRPKTKIVYESVPEEHKQHHDGTSVHPKTVKMKPGEEPFDPFYMLRFHRVLDVRLEARAALLAYGFLRGRTYQQIEGSSYEEPPMRRVVELVQKFGGPVQMEKIANQYQMPPWVSHRPPILSQPYSSTAGLIARWMKDTQWPFTETDDRKTLELQSADTYRSAAQRDRRRNRSRVATG